MERMGVVSRVKEPTDWCAAMVVVPKTGGKVRICVDLTHLNESVRREYHLLPAVEQTLAQLAGAWVFTKLDANSGFWQVPLAKESALLTTFITPLGRFCFNRLPFGMTSAPKHFQRRMSEILQDVEGAICLVDDILIHGWSQEKHDHRLEAVLRRLQEVGLTLNEKKCEFSRPSVKFLGQIVDQSGVRPDPDKVSAILNLRTAASWARLTSLENFPDTLQTRQSLSMICCPRRNSGVGRNCKREHSEKSKKRLAEVQYLLF